MTTGEFITDKLNYPTDFLPSFVHYVHEQGEAIAFGLGATRRGERLNRYCRIGRNGEMIEALIEYGLNKLTFENELFSLFEFQPFVQLGDDAFWNFFYELPSEPRSIPGILFATETMILDVARTTRRKEVDFRKPLQRLISLLPRDERRGRLRITREGALLDVLVNLSTESWTVDRAGHSCLAVPGFSVVLLRESTPIGAARIGCFRSLEWRFSSLFLDSPASSIFETRRCLEWISDWNLHEVELILPPAEVQEHRIGPPSWRDILWSIDEDSEAESTRLGRELNGDHRLDDAPFARCWC